MGMRHVIHEVTLGGRFSSPDFPHYSNLPWVEPSQIEGYETRRQSRHIVHEILGRRDPEVTFREPSLRTGQLRLHFPDEQSICRAEMVFANAEVLQLTPSVDAGYSPRSDLMRMCFVLSGDMDCEFTETHQWIMTLDYQEVNPPPMPTEGTP